MCSLDDVTLEIIILIILIIRVVLRTDFLLYSQQRSCGKRSKEKS